MSRVPLLVDQVKPVSVAPSTQSFNGLTVELDVSPTVPTARFNSSELPAGIVFYADHHRVPMCLLQATCRARNSEV